MTRLNFKLVCLVLFMVLFACTASASVRLTKHDLSAYNDVAWGSNSYQSTELQVCIFCHTPHGGNLNGPLWNRPDTGETFTFYRSDFAFKLELNSVSSVNPESLLCLSCHDGTIGVNNILNFGQTETRPDILASMGNEFPMLGYAGRNPLIGAETSVDPAAPAGHLGDDHPISLHYDQAFANDNRGELRERTVAPLSTSPLQFFGGDRLECSTCHDVHNATIEPFLVMSNEGSAMCLTCHIK